MEQEKIVQLIMQETDNELLQEICNNGTVIERYMALTRIKDALYLSDFLYSAGNTRIVVVFMFLKTLNEDFDPSKYKSICEDSDAMQQLDTEFHIFDNITSLGNTNKLWIANVLYKHFFEEDTKLWYLDDKYEQGLLKEVKKAIVKNSETCAVKLIFHESEYDVIEYIPKETFHKILSKSVYKVIEEEERRDSEDSYDIWYFLKGVCESLFDMFCDRFMNEDEITEGMYAKILVNLEHSVRMRKIVDFCIEKISDENSLKNLRNLSLNWYVKLLAGAKLKEK